jgi:multiple sugar transport system permease protein
VIVVIWKLMLSSSSGIVNSLLIQFHIIEKPIGFFSSSTSAFISLVLINSWRWSPFLALIILSGLKSINQEIYDASKIDGTSFFSEFFFITLPQLKGVLFVLGLVGTLLSFNVFDIIWLITKGGPSSATTTLPLLIYETAFTKFRISQAAALSVITSFILLTFSIVFIKVMGRDNDEE